MEQRAIGDRSGDNAGGAVTRPTYIYVLRDPRTDEIRYVGKTVQSLPQRLSLHIAGARSGARRYSSNWIANVLSDGLVPSIEQIEIAYENWAEREKYWITHYRAANPGRMTNLADGGQGLAGLKRSEEQKKQLSAESKARWADPEYREKLLQKLRSKEVVDRKIASNAEAMKDPEVKERHRRATKAGLNSGDVQARKRLALAATMSDPAVKAKYLATLDFARTDPATKIKHRDASKRAQSDPNLRAHLRKTSTAAWTPERRARQADVMRRSIEKQKADGYAGARASWTEERRAEAAIRILRRMNDSKRSTDLSGSFVQAQSTSDAV